MQKIFVSLLLCSALCLALSSEANSQPEKTSRIFRLLDEYATSTGTIPLTLGDLGFFVHADFFNYQNVASNPTGDTSDYGNMAIALYTDQTYFGQACQGFQDYCQDGKHNASCQLGGTTNSSVFPYFESQSRAISSQVFMDYNHWFLQSPAFYSTSCSGYYAFGGYGLIGMGASSGFSMPNFNGKNPNFAVNIAKNLSNGTIAFNVDLGMAKSSTPAAKLITNNVWHIERVDAIDMKKKTFDANASLIFDLGSDSIGFPKRLYDQVLHYLEASPQIGQCSVGDDSRPTCEFSGDIRHLPSIKLLVGDETIEIPPEVYVVQTQNTTFYYDPIMLKIKSLSTNTTTTKDVLVTEAYKDTIILGYPVMSYYYTVFTADQNGEGTVNLYLSDDYTSASSLTWIFIVAGILGLLLIGATFYVFERKYRKNKELESPLMGSEAVKARGFVSKGKRIQDSQEV